METCTQLRALRLRHGITLDELAAAMGLSNQYISRAELRQIAPTWTLEKKCEAAMEQIISRRYDAAQELERDYRSIKDCLLNFIEGDDHDL